MVCCARVMVAVVVVTSGAVREGEGCGSSVL